MKNKNKLKGESIFIEYYLMWHQKNVQERIIDVTGERKEDIEYKIRYGKIKIEEKQIRWEEIKNDLKRKGTLIEIRNREVAKIAERINKEKKNRGLENSKKTIDGK